jgi:hypothetical protein
MFPHWSPGQTLVVFHRQSAGVVARAFGPFSQTDVTGAPHRAHPYHHLTAPLRQRGVVCTVEYGLSDHVVRAELPDGSALTISPPQEPATDHTPGYPKSWLVTRHLENPERHEVLYNSAPGGPQARYGDSVPHLLATIDARLDAFGLPPRSEPFRFGLESAADAVLHRAGFVPVDRPGEHYHRLPTGMSDPDEQRRAVTQAVDMLHADGFRVSGGQGLIDFTLPIRNDYKPSLGDRLGHTAQTIRAASHTRDVVTELSELTAPGDGVLDHIDEVLTSTADWWESLGAATDPLYADRLRRVTANLQVSAVEIRNLRNELADRHAHHPQAATGERSTHEAPAEQRMSAARALSPAAQHTAPAPQPPAPATPPSATGHRPPSAPSR